MFETIAILQSYFKGASYKQVKEMESKSQVAVELNTVWIWIRIDYVQ